MCEAIYMRADDTILDIIAHSQEGKELGHEDTISLLSATGSDVFDVLKAADAMRKTVVGDTVTYVVNRNINFTNICIGTCRFCGFKDSAPYFLKAADVAQKALAPDITEVCIQGGLHPELSLDYYIDVLESIKNIRPDIHIHAFSPAEVHHMSGLSGESVGKVIKKLKNAGLGSMPGTAAEILVDDIREKICPEKIDVATWVKIIKKAHKEGLPTTATMMYGHVESIADRAEHMLLIRKIQKETRGFTEFVPLSFIAQNELGKTYGLNGSSGIEDLLVYATSRLLFNGYIENIQTSWVKLGRKLAQISLFCGANDIGGTLMEEKISKSSGARYGESMTQKELEDMILQVNRFPRQRSTVYDLL